MITAADAKVQANDVQEFRWPKDPVELEEALYTWVDAVINECVSTRSEDGKFSAWLQPFAGVPGACHDDIKDVRVMDRVCGGLVSMGYKNVEWFLQDKRVQLRFAWD